MPYLVVLPLLAGLFRGFPGVVDRRCWRRSSAVIVVPLLTPGFAGARRSDALALAPWLLTNFGGGLLGVWARSLGSDHGLGDASDEPLRVRAPAAHPAPRPSPGGCPRASTATAWPPS